MTPDERALLQRFLQDLVQTRGVAKDSEADGMILDALRSSPDASYVLVQHAIMSDQALHAAQSQIATLQNQIRDAAPSSPPSRFIPQPSPWAQAAAPPPPPEPQWQPQPPPVQGRGYVGSGPFSGGGGLGSFLKTAGTTAAGVAGGAFLFEGISNLFGGGGHGGGFGGGGFGGGAGPTEVVNNYYEDDGDRGGGDFGGGDMGGWDDGGSGDT